MPRRLVLFLDQAWPFIGCGLMLVLLAVLSLVSPPDWRLVKTIMLVALGGLAGLLIGLGIILGFMRLVRPWWRTQVTAARVEGELAALAAVEEPDDEIEAGPRSRPSGLAQRVAEC